MAQVLQTQLPNSHSTFSGYRIHYADHYSLPSSVLGNFTSLFLYPVQICPKDPMPQDLHLCGLSTSFSNENVLICNNSYGQSETIYHLSETIATTYTKTQCYKYN